MVRVHNRFSILASLPDEPLVEEAEEVEPSPAPWVHVVWFGTGAPDVSNTTTPKKITARGIGIPVTFWCLDQMQGRFKAEFRGTGVKVKSIEGFLNQPIVRARVNRQWLNQILSFYKGHGGFAPAKDLISFLIVAVYGGFYFDANCVIEEMDTFAKAITQASDKPRFLRLNSSVGFVPSIPRALRLESIRALSTREERQAAETALELAVLSGLGEGAVSLNETDMWAFYGPRDHEIFWRVARSYIQRAEIFGLAGAWARRDTLRFKFRLTFAEGEKHQKRMIAGALGVSSLFAGGYWLSSVDDTYQPDVLNWQVASVKDRFVQGLKKKILKKSADYWVADLGLSKAHGNSWI